MKRVPWLFAVLAFGLFLFAGNTRADSFVTAVINNANFGSGPIQSWSLDLTTGVATAAGSFVPDGAVPGGANGTSPNGRGIAVTNTQFYYTELSGGDSERRSISKPGCITEALADLITGALRIRYPEQG